MGVIRRNSYAHTVMSVELDPAQLEEAGWHFEDQCPMLEPELAPGSMDVSRFRYVLESLHRQAHPDQPGVIEMCRKQPCKSVPLAVITARIGRR